MKIGDLVELSKAGSERGGNWTVRKGFGMVIAFEPHSRWPIICHWPQKNERNKTHHFKRYELKKLRSKQNG